MTTLDAILLGIVEGLTEFLPISSTAHLVIASRSLAIPESEFLSSFIFAIQLGAIASVVLLYWKTLLWDFAVMKRIVAAFLPTAMIGFMLYTLVKDVLIESLPVIAGALIVGGIVLIAFERWYQEPMEDAQDPGATESGVDLLGRMPYTTAVLIGIAQALAIVPGVSRAGATIIAGLSLGLPRRAIVEFSFLLAIPTILSATAYDLYKTGASFAGDEWLLVAIGFAVSFVAAAASVKFLVLYVQRHSFAVFGVYRILLGLALFAFTAL